MGLIGMVGAVMAVIQAQGRRLLVVLFSAIALLLVASSTAVASGGYIHVNARVAGTDVGARGLNGGTASSVTVDSNGRCRFLDADVRYSLRGKTFEHNCAARIASLVSCQITGFYMAGKNAAQDSEKFHWGYIGWRA